MVKFRVKRIALPLRYVRHILCPLMVLTFALGTHPPGVAAEGFDDAFPLTWKTRAANGDNGFIPTARSGHCTFQAADMSGFYMFGGKTSFGWIDDSMWYLDYAKWSWRKVPPKPGADAPAARAFHRCATTAERTVALLYGGTDGNDNLNDIWVFDMAKETWSRPQMTVCPSLAPECTSNAVSQNPNIEKFAMTYSRMADMFLLHGGMNAGVVQNTLYAIDLRYNTIDKHWAYTMYILESLEFDGPALHSHTMVEMNVKSQLGTALVLFGGFWNQDIARNNPTPTGSLWYVNTVYVKATTRNLVWKGPLTDVIKQPAPRFGHSAIFNEATSELWSVGGSGVSKDLRVMAVENAFQPSTWSWQSGPSLDIGSFHHTLTPLRIPDSNDKFILVKYGGQANSTHYHKTLEYIAFSIDGQRVPLNYTDNTDNTNEGGPKPGGMPVETIIIIGASVGGSVLLMAGLAFGAHRYRRRILKPKTGSSRRLSRIEAAEGNASSLPPPAAPLRPQAKPPRVAGIRPQKEVKLDRGKTSDYNLNRTPSSEGLINHGGAALNHKLNRAPSSEAQLNRGKTSDNDYAQRASPSEAHHHRDKVSDYNLLRASPAQNPYSPVVEVIPMPQRHAGVHEDHPNVSPIPIHRMPPPADAQLLHGPALRPAPFRAQNSDPQLAVAALSSTPPAPPRKPQFFGSDKPLGQQQFAEAMMMTPAYVRLPYGNGGQSSSHNGQPLPQNGGHSSSHNSGGNGVVRERSRSQSRRDAAQAIPASSPAQVQRSQQPLLPQTKQTPAAGAAAALSSPTPTPPPPSNGQRRHKKLIISDVYTL